jgi:hypothetical protein
MKSQLNLPIFILFSAVIILTTGCGGGDDGGLLDFGDGGSRIVLTGSIMGEQRQVCISQPPSNLTPSQLQDEIDSFLFKAIRWDSGTTVNKNIESDRSCNYKITPFSTLSWENFAASGSNQQLADWGNFVAKTDVSGKRTVDVCLRDTQCEDGDILDITVNGTAVVRQELFNASSCVSIPVNPGVNYVGVYAVNGTGFKGNCSFADANTGEVTVKGNTGQVIQNYQVIGGQGSYGALTIVN